MNMTKVSAVNDMSNTSEAVAALSMLGYSQSEASVAVSKLDPTLSTEMLIRQALKLLSTAVTSISIRLRTRSVLISTLVPVQLLL